MVCCRCYLSKESIDLHWSLVKKWGCSNTSFCVTTSKFPECTHILCWIHLLYMSAFPKFWLKACVVVFETLRTQNIKSHHESYIYIYIEHFHTSSKRVLYQMSSKHQCRINAALSLQKTHRPWRCFPWLNYSGKTPKTAATRSWSEG